MGPMGNEATDLTTVIHVAGIDIIWEGRQRQRCAWCGALLLDRDLKAMSWLLNEDGSDPGPPGPLGPGVLYEIAGGMDESFRGVSRIDPDQLPKTDDGEGVVPPPNACVHLDPEITA